MRKRSQGVRFTHNRGNLFRAQRQGVNVNQMVDTIAEQSEPGLIKKVANIIKKRREV